MRGLNMPKPHLGHEARCSGGLRINFEHWKIFNVLCSLSRRAFSTFRLDQKNGLRGGYRSRVLEFTVALINHFGNNCCPGINKADNRTGA